MDKVHTFIICVIVVVVVLGVFGFFGNSLLGLQPVQRAAVNDVNVPAGNTSQKNQVVRVMVDAAVGSYVTDPAGYALYTTTKENCIGECLVAWPPYLANNNLVQEGKLGMILRDDLNRIQYTWAGNPLYYYIGDSQPGDVNGNNFKNVWFLARP